jgi:phytoene dehydrogenase-like protein
MSKEVIIIGGGIDGLSAAVRLAAGRRDVHVTLLEESDRLGGCASMVEVEHPRRSGQRPFRFDLSPHPLTMPYVLLDLFAAAGQDVRDHLQIVKIDPVNRYVWPDGTHFDVRAAEPDLRDAIAAIRPGDVEGWMRLLAAGRRAWEASERLAQREDQRGTLQHLLDGFGRIGTIMRLALEPGDEDRVERELQDPRLRDVWRYELARHPPSEPGSTRLTACWIEYHYGAWHIVGGTQRLVEKLEAIARNAGVEIRLNCPVLKGGSADTTPRAAKHAVQVADGAWLWADHVITTSETCSAGGPTLLLGIEGELALPYRTTLFMDGSRTPPSAIEINCPSRAHPELAPAGCHALTIRAPAELGVEEIIRVLDLRLGTSGLEARTVVRQMLTPSGHVNAGASAGVAQDVLRGKALSESFSHPET